MRQFQIQESGKYKISGELNQHDSDKVDKFQENKTREMTRNDDEKIIMAEMLMEQGLSTEAVCRLLNIDAELLSGN